MELWEQIMKRASMANIHDSDLELSKVLLSACYVALEKIREVLSDASIEDDDCFTRIENIVCIYEQLGSECGARHDF